MLPNFLEIEQRTHYIWEVKFIFYIRSISLILQNVFENEVNTSLLLRDSFSRILQ